MRLRDGAGPAPAVPCPAASASDERQFTTAHKHRILENRESTRYPYRHPMGRRRHEVKKAHSSLRRVTAAVDAQTEIRT